MNTAPARPIADLTERRRAATLAALLARIAEATPSREDVQHFAGGHVWKRYPHERAVLKVVARREDALTPSQETPK